MGVSVSLKLPPVSGPHSVSCTDIMVGPGKEGSFFRLFYPCGSSNEVQHAPWVSRSEYVTAFTKYLGWNSKIIQYGSSLILGHPQIPIGWNSPFVSGQDRKPLVIFSHGLGAFRTAYSTLCMELASRGFVVAAIEHRDGSACATYHFVEVSPGLAQANPQEVWVPFRKVESGMKEFYLRNYQLHQRANECVRAMQVLRDIDSGRDVSNLIETSFNLKSLKDRLDLSRVTIMGHSFGGASALLSLVKDDTFRCAVALDAWMFPLEDASYTKIQKPTLFINAENFQTESSVQKMKRLNSGRTESKIMTVLGSAHQSQTDFAFITGFMANKILGTPATMDPLQCMDITIALTLSFLHKHLDLTGNFPDMDNLNEEIRAHIIPDFPLKTSSKL